ncbi:MAG: TfpX/TfpZ family type IV pilin accessory protein [bacterium]
MIKTINLPFLHQATASPFFAKEKIKPFLIHLAISFVISLSFLLFIITVWFPHDFMTLTGINHIALMIIGIDVILGPLLTFIVYNVKKKHLWFDLTFIALLQASAFAYGAYTIYQGHPVYITFNADRFTLVSARDATPEKAKFKEYKISTFGKPKLAYAESPTNTEERNTFLFSVLFQNAPDLDSRVDYYKPYQANIDKILAKSLLAEHLFKQDQHQALLKPYLNDYTLESLAFLPIQGKEAFMIYVLDRKTAQPLGTINLDPWDIQAKNTAKPNV